MRKKKVGRPKSDKSKKKVSVKITVDPDVLAEAELSLNVSGWFNELGRVEVNKIRKLKKPIS
jgi:post-segregation antitoxin (ccd killing protein)